MSELPITSNDSIICPYCGHKHCDDLPYTDATKEFDCENCGKEFQLEIETTISYTAQKFENIQKELEERIEYWKNPADQFKKDPNLPGRVIEMLMTELQEVKDKIKAADARLEKYKKSGLFLREEINADTNSETSQNE